MIRKSDKKLKDRTKEDKIAKNEGFDEFFNQVLKNMPARSAKIIKSSFVVSRPRPNSFWLIILKNLISFLMSF